MIGVGGNLNCERYPHIAAEKSVALLESTWTHRPHTGFDPEIIYMLGLAYFQWVDHSGRNPDYEPALSYRLEAVALMCQSIELQIYKDNAQTRLDDRGESCQ